MGQDGKTDNLQGRDGSDISIWSHGHPLKRSEPGRCLMAVPFDRAEDESGTHSSRMGRGK